MELIFDADIKIILLPHTVDLSVIMLLMVTNFYPENGCSSERLVRPYQIERCHNTYYTMNSALFWDITKLRVVILYRRFGTMYRSHLQESRRPLKMGPIGCPETSVKDYLSTLHNTPEERRSDQHRSGGLKSRRVRYAYSPPVKPI